MPKQRNNVPYVTPDYKSMMATVIWSSVGMFYFEFVIIQFSQIVGITASGIGIMFSLMTVGNMITSPIMGILSDKMEKNRLASMGIYGRALAYLVVYIGILMKNLYIFYLGGLILGATVQAFWIPFNSLIAEKSHRHHRSTAYAIRDKSIGWGMIFGAIFAFTIFFYSEAAFPSNLAVQFSPLVIFASSNIYAGILFGRKVVPELKFTYTCTSEDSTKENGQNGNLKRTLNLLKYGLIFLIIGFFIGAINESVARPFLQLYILENITSDTQLMTFIYIPSGMFTMIFAPILGKIGDRVDPRMGIVFTIIAGSLVTFTLINISNPILFSLMLVIDGAIARTEGLIFSNFISRITKNHRGKLFGMQNFFSQLGFVIGPLLGGFLWDSYSSQSPFILSIFVELTLIPIILISIKWIAPSLEEK